MPRIRSEGGSGGRKGHSNMSHRDKTAEVKAMARKRRRQDDKTARDED